MSSTLLSLVVIALVGILIPLSIKLRQTQQERDRLRQDLRRYESLTSREETERQLDSNIQLKQNELQELNVQQRELKNAISNLQSKFRELEAKNYLILVDNYEPKYNFVHSSDYLQRLKQIEVRQKEMRDNNQAFVCDTKWTIGEGKRGKKRGERMIADVLKTIEFAFEALCKYAIKEVRYNNVDSLKKKIQATHNKINNYLQKLDCRISKEYLDLKLIELDLKYEFEEKDQEEREKEKANREQMRQEEKERREIEKAQREAEEAEQRERELQEDIERKRLEETTLASLQLEERQEYERQIKELERLLVQSRQDKERAFSSCQRLKSGYIYVISNIGSLRGQDLYRIGMTKRATPDKYVTDMNPAVPFEFDVHFKIHSHDVLDTLEKLHNRFNDRRVNEVNSRRDFFQVSLDEIKEAVEEIKEKTEIVRIDKFEPVPQAYEYRKTLAARKKKQHLANNDLYLEEDTIG